jgi:hypothetical protein
MDDLGRHYLDDALRELRKYKAFAERAAAQVEDEAWFRTLDPESNSIALVMKHMTGNMRSRWTDFLTTDGEKPSRNRDSEFVTEDSDTAASIRERWEDGWARVFEAIEALEPADLGKTITIRGEKHTVLQAINRQLTHYASHVGQIVFLAKHLAGDRWETLSIPRGKSLQFDVSKSGAPYRP